MSTRAVYTFLHFPLTADNVAFYVHHDGYPSGAAHYLRASLEKCELQEVLPTSFYHALHPRAEQCVRAEDFGDLSYKWLFVYHSKGLNKGKVLMSGWRRNMAAAEIGIRPEWLRVCGPEPIEDFIARYPADA